MSGHSKWKNIMHKKGKTDAQRAKVFTKLGREIAVAVKSGGSDPESNSKLKDAIAKAKSNNMPNDNINRCIQKAAGENGGDNYENLIYEGYGPNGVAVIVETLTDNRNRTAGDMRHYFDKFGGNLGQSGSVMFMFDQKGVIAINNEQVKDEDELTMQAIELGAEEVEPGEEIFEITTAPEDFSKMRDALEESGYTFEMAEIQYVPQTSAQLTDEKDITMMNKLIDMLEDNDDVQAVWHNWDNDEE